MERFRYSEAQNINLFALMELHLIYIEVKEKRVGTGFYCKYEK